MQIPQLDDATLATVRRTQAHRFPQVATLRPPAARGVGAVEIKIVLGNPSGACAMPAGATVSPAWSQYVFPALSSAPDPKGLADLLARDMVIWPNALVVDEMLSEWPALGQTIARLAASKIGRTLVSDPQPFEKPPEYVADALEARPRSTWRWVRPPKGAAASLVVDAPSAFSFQTFGDEMRDPAADHWRVVREFVAGCVPLVFDEHGHPTSLDAMIQRWPGLAISLAKEAAVLGGVGATAELGE